VTSSKRNVMGLVWLEAVLAPNKEVIRTCWRRLAVEDHLFLSSDFILSFWHAVYIV